MNRGPQRHLIACIALAAVGLVAFGVSSAFAHSTNGGNTIASAPELPLGHTVPSGWGTDYDVDNTGSPGEFWRLKMAAGDGFVIDVASTAQGCEAAPISIYAPNVTDYTISQTNPIERFDSGGATRYEYKWVAPSAGEWRLFFNEGCAPYSYTFNALLQLFTSTTLSAPPSVVAVHSKVRLSGRISNGASGKVLLSVQGPHHFKLSKLLPLAGGQFKFSFNPRRTGRYYASARYSGDSHHRPSRSKRYTIRVVK